MVGLILIRIKRPELTPETITDLVYLIQPTGLVVLKNMFEDQGQTYRTRKPESERGHREIGRYQVSEWPGKVCSYIQVW